MVNIVYEGRAYHFTPGENVRGILEKGLLPGEGKGYRKRKSRSRGTKYTRTYFFKTLEDAVAFAEDVIGGSEQEESSKLIVLDLKSQPTVVDRYTVDWRTREPIGFYTKYPIPSSAIKKVIPWEEAERLQDEKED